MHQKVFDKVTTKKEQNQEKPTKKQDIGHNFLIDFLFFIPHEQKNCIYLRKRGQTPELARHDWLESLLAEEMNVAVEVNHLLLPRLHWDMSLKNTQNHFIVTVCSWFF